MNLTLKQTIYRNLINLPGWKTNRKIVVIESDDWGSIRIPTTDSYKSFIENGFEVDKSDYNRLDSLENNDDLLELFSTLSSHLDSSGRPPVITANTIVANPYFDKIKANNFEHYYYEHFSKTLSRYPVHDYVLAYYKEGINNNFMFY